MGKDEGDRRLAAILSADVAGYSRLMGDDERATVRTLTDYRKVFSEHIERHKGRVVDTAGDSVLAVFGSVVEAVQCSVNVQSEIANRNSALEENRRMDFRVGINLGDVIEQDDGTIYGDGVNIAARLESLARPGGITVSGTVFDHAENKLPVAFEFAGEQAVKNIVKPVRVYRVVRESGEAAAITPKVDHPSGVVDQPSIAVLPFANMGGDQDQEYFSDGITEDIITSLSRFDQFGVLARNSTFQYKGKSVDIREVGKALSAQYIMEGSVRRSANRIRVTAQLIDAHSGEHVWVETFDRDLNSSDIFDVQDSITRHVVGALGGTHGAVMRNRGNTVNEESSDRAAAYDAVLRARNFFNRSWTTEAHFDARERLECIVQKYGEYADAWSALASLYRVEHAYGFNELPNALARSEHAARRALQLNPAHQAAHKCMSYLKFHRKDPGFRDSFERVLKQNPHDTTLLFDMGALFAFSGDWNRGVELVDRAFRMNPNTPTQMRIVNLWDSYRKGDYEAALEWGHQIDWSGVFWPHAANAMALGQLGRLSEARAALEVLQAMYTDFAEHAQEELDKWFWEPDLVDHMIEGLRKAGLDIPDEPSADN